MEVGETEGRGQAEYEVSGGCLSEQRRHHGNKTSLE